MVVLTPTLGQNNDTSLNVGVKTTIKVETTH